MKPERLSPFNVGRKLTTLQDAAEAAADILAHLSFVDDEDAEHARKVEVALRRALKRGVK